MFPRIFATSWSGASPHAAAMRQPLSARPAGLPADRVQPNEPDGHGPRAAVPAAPAGRNRLWRAAAVIAGLFFLVHPLWPGLPVQPAGLVRAGFAASCIGLFLLPAVRGLRLFQALLLIHCGLACCLLLALAGGIGSADHDLPFDIALLVLGATAVVACLRRALAAADAKLRADAAIAASLAASAAARWHAAENAKQVSHAFPRVSQLGWGCPYAAVSLSAGRRPRQRRPAHGRAAGRG